MDTAAFTRRMRPLLGTFVEIGVPPDRDETAVNKAFAAIEKIERLLSFQNPDSELSQLNRSRGEFLTLSAPTVRVLRLARAITRRSDGLFNCTVGGLLVNHGTLPDHGGPAFLPLGSADDIDIRGRRVRLVRPVRITVDGIAKGYAVDRAVGVLKRHGIPAGWVNAGGDLRTFGDVCLPVTQRHIDGTFETLGGLRDAAVATSAVSDKRQRRFPGLITGDNGVPAKGLWSVVARAAWRADALTKVAALAPSVERSKILTRLGGRLVGAAHA